MCSSGGKRLVRQAFRFELDPNRAQRVLLAKSVGANRFVYNWGLTESQRVYKLTGGVRGWANSSESWCS